MWRDGLGEVGCRGRILAEEVNAVAVDWPTWNVPLQEIGRGSVGLPIPTQQFKQFRGEENKPILMPFALTHDDHLPVAINIGDAKIGGLRGAQAGGIDCRENRVMFEVGGGLKQREHFRLREKEAQGTDGLNDRGPGDLALLNQKELVFSDVGRSE